MKIINKKEKKKLTKADKLKIIRLVIFAIVVIVIIIFSFKLFNLVNNLSNDVYRLEFEQKVRNMGFLRSISSYWITDNTDICSCNSRTTC